MTSSGRTGPPPTGIRPAGASAWSPPRRFRKSSGTKFSPNVTVNGGYRSSGSRPDGTGTIGGPALDPDPLTSSGAAQNDGLVGPKLQPAAVRNVVVGRLVGVEQPAPAGAARVGPERHPARSPPEVDGDSQGLRLGRPDVGKG